MEESEIGGGQVSFDELEEQSAVTTSRKLAEITIDAEDAPEELKGKSAAEIATLISGMKEALANSRDTIDTLRAVTREQPKDTSVVQQTVVEEPKELSEAEMKELYETDPFAYHQKMYERMERRTQQTINTHVAPLASTSAESAKAQAMQKYAEEFEILGEDIDRIVKTIPDPRALAQPGAWDQIVKYVRGDQLDKFLAGKQKKSEAASLNAARAAERDNGGGSFTGSRRDSSGRRVLGELSATQKEICKIQGISEADYRKYYL